MKFHKDLLATAYLLVAGTFAAFGFLAATGNDNLPMRIVGTIIDLLVAVISLLVGLSLYLDDTDHWE